jgi:thiol-disulfide isomerase/thioredoxin
MSLFRIFPICSQGIEFRNISLEEAFVKAKQENKPVFLDGFTNHCGACVTMDKNVFPVKEVGDFFNEHFINVKLNFEEGDGPALRKRYKVSAFPTYLLLTENGEELYRYVGSNSVKGFIDWAERGMLPQHAISVLEKEFESGKMTKQRLVDYFQAMYIGYKPEIKKEVTNRLNEQLTLEDKLSAAYWPFFGNTSWGKQDKMIFIGENKDIYRKVLGEDEINNYLYGGYEKVFNDIIFAPEDKTQEQPALEKLQVIKRQVEALEASHKEVLVFKADIVLALAQQQWEEVIALLEKHAPHFPFSQVMNIRPIIDKLYANNNASLARIIKLGDVLVENSQEDNAKHLIVNYFDEYKDLYKQNN